MDKYWIIPKKLINREEIDVVDFLKECGYRIGNFKVDTRDIYDDDTRVGEIFEDAFRVDINWPVEFNAFDVKKIKNLITLLEINEVPHTEKPKREKAIENYEEQFNDSMDLMRE
jgi:hypothetical protein